MQLPPRKHKPPAKKWSPTLSKKEKRALSKQRKPNGTRLHSRYTLPKAHRAAPETSGFPITPREGRAPYEPTQGDRKFVAKLVAYGMTSEQICSLIESRYGECLSPETLRKYFKNELATGTEELVIWSSDLIVNHAKRGSLAAAIFINKTRGRWAEKVNIADANGNVIQPPNVIIAFGAEEDDEEFPEGTLPEGMNPQ